MLPTGHMQTTEVANTPQAGPGQMFVFRETGPTLAHEPARPRLARQLPMRWIRVPRTGPPWVLSPFFSLRTPQVPADMDARKPAAGWIGLILLGLGHVATGIPANAADPFPVSFSRMRYFRPTLFYEGNRFLPYDQGLSASRTGAPWLLPYDPYQPRFSADGYYQSVIQSQAGLDASWALTPGRSAGTTYPIPVSTPWLVPAWQAYPFPDR